MDPGTSALARHAEALATVRAFGVRAAARRVVLLPEPGEVLVEWEAGGALALTEGDDRLEIPVGAMIPGAVRPLPELRPPPASAVRADPTTGEIAAPFGVIAHLGEAVLGLAAAFGGRSVATVEWATADPDLPITIAARDGEPLVLEVGDRQFEL